MRDENDSICGFNPLKPDVKEKWLSALRSGDYKQTRATLSDTMGYCCLGVVANECLPKASIARMAGAVMSVSPYPDRPMDLETVGVGYSASLPDWALGYLELDPDAQTRLIELNDTEQADFSSIADWIEKVL